MAAFIARLCVVGSGESKEKSVLRWPSAQDRGLPGLIDAAYAVLGKVSCNVSSGKLHCCKGLRATAGCVPEPVLSAYPLTSRTDTRAIEGKSSNVFVWREALRRSTPDIPTRSVEVPPSALWHGCGPPRHVGEWTPQKTISQSSSLRGMCARPQVFSISNESCSGEIGCGLYLEAATANHSCIPNASQSFQGKTLSLRCTRPISEGEEITIGIAQIQRPGPLRRESLRASYFFNCRCER